MNALAIDHGTKKCGLAYGIASVAVPIGVVRTHDIITRLQKEIIERKIDTIVVGIANHMDGRTSKQAHLQREFIKRLDKAFPDITIVVWDERLTSMEALHAFEEQGLSEDGPIDDIAATILLQSYFDSLLPTDICT